MALHGSIKVNDVVIGFWSAVRQEHPPGEVNTYKVEVTFHDIHGVVHHEQGEITHKYGDGALVLTREVMDWASKRIYPGSSICWACGNEVAHETGHDCPMADDF